MFARLDHVWSAQVNSVSNIRDKFGRRVVILKLGMRLAGKAAQITFLFCQVNGIQTSFLWRSGLLQPSWCWRFLRRFHLWVEGVPCSILITYLTGSKDPDRWSDNVARLWRIFIQTHQVGKQIICFIIISQPSFGKNIYKDKPIKIR